MEFQINNMNATDYIEKQTKIHYNNGLRDGFFIGIVFVLVSLSVIMLINVI